MKIQIKRTLVISEKQVHEIHPEMSRAHIRKWIKQEMDAVIDCHIEDLLYVPEDFDELVI